MSDYFWLKNRVKEVPSKDLEDYGFYPEDSRGCQVHCLGCYDSLAQQMSGFIKTVFMYKIKCKKCGLDAIFYEDLGVVEPHNRYVHRLDAENKAKEAIRSAAYGEPRSAPIRIANDGTRARLIEYKEAGQ